MNWPEVAALAERQCGLVTTAQLSRLGLGRQAVAHAVAAGRLVPQRRGVYAVDGLPPDVWRPLAAALVDIDAVASHRAAAGLHRFPGIRPGAVEIMVFGAPSPERHGVVTHRASVLHPPDVLEVQGLPATSPARTLVDLAAQIETPLLQRMLDDCTVRRLCTVEDVAECLGRFDRKRGSRRLRPLLQARLRSESHLEQVWLRRLHRAGLTPPAIGHQLVIDNHVLVLDFAWPAQRVGVEVDGWQPHSTRSRFDGDRLRDLAAVRVGWTILRVTSRTPPSQLFATLRSLISE